MVQSLETSYVDKLVARNPLGFSKLSTSLEFLIAQNKFLPDINFLTVSYDMILTAVRQEVNNLETAQLLRLFLDFLK